MKRTPILIVIAALMSQHPLRAAEPELDKGNPTRFRIVQAVTGVKYEKDPETRSENTILLDTETGKSWLLWPTADTPSGYSWIELPMRKDAPADAAAPATPKGESPK